MRSKTITKKTTRVPKTRNANTMTEAAFWQFIRSSLRNRSRWWKPILNCKNHARRAYNGSKKRQKWEYHCNICKQWFPEKMISVDHIIPVGVLNCAEDLPGFVERLFCEEEFLQTICSDCHDIKTKNERNERKV